jgi:hypothetical protein
LCPKAYAIHDNAQLTLSGVAGVGGGKLILNGDETIGSLVIDGRVISAGTYTSGTLDVIVGSGTLTAGR